MSWYRRLTRFVVSMLAERESHRNLISMPLVENPPGPSHMTYMDIGHSDPSFNTHRKSPNVILQPTEEQLWIVTPDYQLETQDASTESEWDIGRVTHEEAFMMMDDVDEEGNDLFVAKGRYSKSEQFPTGVISMILHPHIERMKMSKPQRCQYVVKNVIDVLERQWGAGVRIMQF